jgi:hypothetical protein
MTDFTSRAATLDDVADVSGRSGDITARAGTADDWLTITGEAMRTLDDVATIGEDVPEPVPDPVADFTFTPSAPTDATPVTLTSTATPEEYIQIHEWQQTMPGPGAPVEGPPVMNLGLLEPGPHVWQLRVRLTDGRWSTPRARGVTVTAAE